MGRTQIAKALIEGNIRKKQDFKAKIQILESYLKRVHENYLTQKISYSRYIEILNKKTNNKTVHEWIEHFETSIKYCEVEIEKEKKKLIQKKILVSFSIFFFLSLTSFIFYLDPTFIGFLIQENPQNFTETLNLQFAESKNYELNLKNSGQLTSLKLSGSIEGQGNVNVFLDDLLILKSQNIESNVGITGSSISETKENYSLIEYIFGFIDKSFSKVTGRIADEDPVETEASEPEEIPEEEQDENIENLNEDASQEDLSPSQGASSSGKPEEITKGKPDDVKEKPKKETPGKGSLSPPSRGSGGGSRKKTPDLKTFTDLCEETCNLSSLNLNKNSYVIRIEISNLNTILNIDEIIYKLIFPEEKIPEDNVTAPIQLENITEPNATIKTTQFQAILGKPVRWEKNIQLNKAGIIKVKIPKDAINISVIKIDDNLLEKEIIQENSNSLNINRDNPQESFSPKNLEISSESKIKKAKFTITGQVTSKPEKVFFLFENLKKVFATITGRVVEIKDQEEELEVIIDDNATSYKIEYETPAPYAVEELLEKGRGKKVKIVGPETIHYKNVLAFTNLSESFKIKNPEKIKIQWIENNTLIPTQEILDLNGNGIYDYVSWIVPVLSNQTFNIIVIIKAEHLDSNRDFISDIFKEVKALDSIWSETINDSEYVRVTFEIPLDLSRDITVYPRTISGSPRIEIYEYNQSVIIAEFTSINDHEYNKVFLTGLIGDQDVFDLRILDGSLEFDHIIDPTTEITTCQTLSTAGETYVLQNDITGISGTCFDITADNITINGNGFTIDGDDSGSDYGITANTQDNLTIKNFKNITDFDNAIYFISLTNSTVINNTMESNTNVGILLQSSSNNIITNNTANSNSFYGINLITASQDNQIINNIFNLNDNYGIFINGGTSSNNTIINNTMNSNTQGIQISSSSDNTVTNNVMNSNTQYGINLQGSAKNNQFLNNEITNSGTNEILDSSGASNNNSLIYNNSLGDIRWNNNGSGSFVSGLDLIGNIGLDINLTIGNNTVFLNASAFTTGLINSSTNITLFGMDSFSFSDPAILRNGLDCGSDCSNFTHLDAATVKFNVTYAGANYSIGESTKPPEITIVSPTNTTFSTGDIDYNITVDENLHTAFYSIDNGNNLSLDNDSNTNYFNLSGNHPNLSDGFHNITFWVNDSNGNANESTEFFTVDKILLTSCKSLDTAGTTYTLQNDITTTGTCFTITADNITLDGNGFAIDGDDTGADFGVTANGRDNLTIKNFKNITDFQRGIRLDITSNSLIKNNTANSNTAAGIRLNANSDNNTITNNTFKLNVLFVIILLFEDETR